MTKIIVGCVIPCYKGGIKTVELVENVLKHADMVVIVDDRCPFHTGLMLEKKYLHQKSVAVIFNQYNMGVGGSTKKGIEYLLAEKCDVIVKLDADGQMNPGLIPKLIKPVVNGEFEAAKGNRFTSLDQIMTMPKTRIIGNLGLSFLSKLSTGYWELFDPTNGFFAIKSSAIRKVRIDKTDNRFFFESDLLFQCALANISFYQLPMYSSYGNEESSLQPLNEIFNFTRKHFINFFKRLIYQYILLDFNIGSIELIIGSITLIILFFYSMWIYLNGLIYGQFASPGEASFITLLAITSVQMLLGFIYFDSTHQPMMRRLNSKI